MSHSIHSVILDIDGIMDHSPRFSDRYSKEFGVPIESMVPFFKGPFAQCVLGKSDLKEELAKVMVSWKWNGSVDELLAYWFGDKLNPDKRMFDVIRALKLQGIHVYGATNQEKYRMKHLHTSLQLDKHFEKIFVSCELNLSKVDESYYKTVLEDIHAKPEETLFWDDDMKKIDAARRVGIIAYEYTDYDTFMKQIATHSISLD